MTRSSHLEKTHRLNAAFNLLAQGYALADAADTLSQKFGFSRRQAYRYLQAAQALEAPVPVASPSLPITIKMPEEVAIRLRAHAQTSGMTMGEIAAQAIIRFLDSMHHHG
jgi:predicted DNA-binding transcriptional regulator YafY